MSNIINVKEERNVLSFEGDVFNLVANSSNFFLKFTLDSEWELNKIVTVIFNFDGKNEYVELDDERMCQIPPTNASRIWFCITTEPDDVSKLSSTILSLDVEESGDTDLDHVEAYQNAHANLMGVVQNLLTGNVNAKNAEFAAVAGVSQTQVSLTGDEEVAGQKNFTGKIKHNSKDVPDSTEFSNPNLIINPNFKINQRDKQVYTRSGTDIYTADRWGLFHGNGRFNTSKKTLLGMDESEPTVFGQWIEDSADILYGETLTLGATINDVRYVKTITLPQEYAEDYIDNVFECDDFVFRLYVSAEQKKIGVQFLVVNGITITISKVKLEISPYETKYVDRSTAEEMALCQRYYQRLHVYSVGYGYSAEKILFFVNTTNTLKSGLNFSFVSVPYIVRNGVKTKIPETVTVNIVGKNGVVFTLAGSGYALNEPYSLVGGVIAAEGEFYL